MSLPENMASSVPVVSALLAPDTPTKASRLVDFELGGVALGDASQGVQVRAWRAYIDGAMVCVAPYPEGSPATELFSADGVTELALSFDQLMHPTVAFVQDGMTKLYWYDSLEAGQVTTSFPGASSPMVCLDDKRPLQVQAGVTDVLFFYVLDGELCYRQQRDRFTVERVLAPLAGASRITGAGMGANGRVQVFLSSAQAVHVDLAADDVYLVGGDGDVRALHGGTVVEAIWRSGIFETHDQASMGWARVESTAYPVTLVVLADSQPIATLAVVSDQPLRLPAIRAREWMLEVRGTARVVGVLIAGSREELEAADANL
ncbi:MAG TPA: hypothetical protein VGE36_13820 [Roseateles sp.]